MPQRVPRRAPHATPPPVRTCDQTGQQRGRAGGRRGCGRVWLGEVCAGTLRALFMPAAHTHALTSTRTRARTRSHTAAEASSFQRRRAAMEGAGMSTGDIDAVLDKTKDKKAAGGA